MTTRRILFFTVFLVPWLLPVIGCSKRAAVQAIGVDAGSAMTMLGLADGSLEASNGDEKTLVRYEEDEEGASGEATLASATTLVLASMPNGPVIGSLKRGDRVERLAERHGFFLVRGAGSDAGTGDAGTTALGWIAKYALKEDPLRAPGRKLAVPSRCPPVALLITQDEPRCDYACKRDGECLNGTTCEVAIVVDRAAPIVSATPTYTTVCTPPPGLPTPDAGAPRGLFGAPRGLDGKCPAGFVAAPKRGPLCYRTCRNDDECPLGAVCRGVESGKLCFAN